MKRTISLILAFLCIFLFVGCTANKDFPEVSSAQVESISVWAGHAGDEKQLTNEEMNTFIELYNQSQYMGEGTGNGGTPDFGVIVYYKDGSIFTINEFNGRNLDFEVFFSDANGRDEAWCYVNNQELLDFVAAIADDVA